MASSSTALTARITLGKTLKRLRSEVRGLTVRDVGERLGCDPSLVSLIENAKRKCSQEMFARLMDLYEVSQEERERLATVLTDGREQDPPWWQRYNDVITASYARFLAFEASAASTREYQLGIIPGLLQTEAYARAVTAVGFASLGPDQVDGLVEVRSLRQRTRLLDTDQPMSCRYVVTQAALNFQVGGPQVQAEQLEWLLDLSEHKAVDLRVVPYEKGADGCQLSGFKIFSFGDADIPDIAFSDSVIGNQTVDDPRDLRRMHRLFRSLSDAALPPGETRDLIARIKGKED